MDKKKGQAERGKEASKENKNRKTAGGTKQASVAHPAYPVVYSQPQRMVQEAQTKAYPEKKRDSADDAAGTDDSKVHLHSRDLQQFDSNHYFCNNLWCKCVAIQEQKLSQSCSVITSCNGLDSKSCFRTSQ